MKFPWHACNPGQPASAGHQCWEDLRQAGQVSQCQPKLEDQSCQAMIGYGAPAMAPFAIVACVTVAAAIALACSLRMYTCWSRRGFSEVQGDDLPRDARRPDYGTDADTDVMSRKRRNTF